MVDLNRGLMVGLIARIGEPARAEWPIQFQAVRAISGAGLIDINFTPGLYHPVQAGAFLELIYIPSLNHIQNVRINRKVFIVKPTENRSEGYGPVQGRNRISNPKTQC